MSRGEEGHLSCALWRRLDAPGHDACRLRRTPEGWELRGSAAFLHDNVPTSLKYGLDCDRRWLTRSGWARGWTGDRAVHVRIDRDPGSAWLLGGEPVGALDDRQDLDFGFTPATNLVQLRRLSLQIGERATVPVVWWDLSSATLEPLEQVYERQSESAYWYEAVRFGYSATLIVDPDGFVQEYPGLWKRES